MRYTLTLEFPSAAEMVAYLASSSDHGITAKSVTEDAPAKPTKAAKVDKATTAADEPAELVYETDVRPHVVNLSKTHGRDAALEVVSKFSNEDDEPCANAKDVQASDWPLLVKRVKAAQAKLDKAKAAAEAEED